jgi:hypothetical protein
MLHRALNLDRLFRTTKARGKERKKYVHVSLSDCKEKLIEVLEGM